jgi:hypothetical protein
MGFRHCEWNPAAAFGAVGVSSEYKSTGEGGGEGAGWILNPARVLLPVMELSGLFPLGLAARCLLELLLVGATGLGALGLGGSFLAGCSLEFFAFFYVFHCFGIGHFLLVSWES